MMCDKTLLDKIANNVNDIEKHLEEHHVRWLEHLEKINLQGLTRRVLEKESEKRKTKKRSGRRR